MDTGGGFRFVKGHGSLPVGREIEVESLSKAAYRKVRTSALAACLVVAVAAASITGMWTHEKYAVSVDINSSYEFVFNDFNRLVAAKAFDPEGAALLKELHLEGTVGEVLLELINAEEVHDNINLHDESEVMLITVVENRDHSENKCLAEINAMIEEEEIGSAVVEVCTRECDDRSDGMEVTHGRLMLAERLHELDPSVPVEQALEMPLCDLLLAVNEPKKARKTR